MAREPHPRGHCPARRTKKSRVDPQECLPRLRLVHEERLKAIFPKGLACSSSVPVTPSNKYTSRWKATANGFAPSHSPPFSSRTSFPRSGQRSQLAVARDSSRHAASPEASQLSSLPPPPIQAESASARGAADSTTAELAHSPPSSHVLRSITFMSPTQH